MRDPDEIQQHESKQQELLERLQKEVYDFEESEGENSQKKVAVGLILAALAYLAPRGGEAVEGQVLGFDFIPVLRFFAAKVVKPIKEFTDNEEEQLVLIARFLEWVVSSFTSPFRAALLRSQI